MIIRGNSRKKPCADAVVIIVFIVFLFFVRIPSDDSEISVVFGEVVVALSHDDEKKRDEI